MQSKNYDIEVVVSHDNGRPVKAVFYGYPVVFEGGEYLHEVVPPTVAGSVTDPTLLETIDEWVTSAHDNLPAAGTAVFSRWMDGLDELLSIKPIRSIVNYLPSFEDGLATTEGTNA